MQARGTAALSPADQSMFAGIMARNAFPGSTHDRGDAPVQAMTARRKQSARRRMAKLALLVLGR